VGRHCKRSEAIHAIVRLMDCFVAALLAMTAASLALHFPGRRAVFVVLERDAHRGELVAQHRHCEQSEAIHAIVRLMDCFVAALLAVTAARLALHFPGRRAVFVVFERDAHRGELVAQRRHCERSEAIHVIVRLMDCFVAALLAMTSARQRFTSHVVVPSLLSLSAMPMAASSSRMRSDSFQFFAARAARRI
jgi:hypothetical protein